MIDLGPDAGVKVATLVKDVVVRQKSLRGDRDDALVVDRRQGIGDMGTTRPLEGSVRRARRSRAPSLTP